MFPAPVIGRGGGWGTVQSRKVDCSRFAWRQLTFRKSGVAKRHHLWCAWVEGSTGRKGKTRARWILFSRKLTGNRLHFSWKLEELGLRIVISLLAACVDVFAGHEPRAADMGRPPRD
jgi:hypothetical protein